MKEISMVGKPQTQGLILIHERNIYGWKTPPTILQNIA
jgi:hypothetical protein